MYTMLKRLFLSFSKKRRIQCLIAILLIVLASLIDILSVISILPFLAVITNPDALLKIEYFNGFKELLKLKNNDEIILLLTFIFSFFSIMSAIIRIISYKFQCYLSYSLGSDISIEILKQNIYKEYVEILNINSSEIISLCTTKSQYIISHVIVPIFNIISSTFLIIGISSLLIFINWKGFLFSFLFFGSIYLFLSFFYKSKIFVSSKIMNFYLKKSILGIQEILGSIKDITLKNNQKYFINQYINNNKNFRDSQINIQSISILPKFLIEGVGFAFIAWLAFLIVKNDQFGGFSVPILGVIALSSQKLLPTFQLLYHSLTTIAGTRHILDSVSHELINNIENKKRDSLLIDNSIFESFRTLEFKNISFSYPGSSVRVINSINLTIKRGEKIGIIGETGCGKSTLIDIISGLILPNQGKIFINDKETSLLHEEWRRKISQIPQKIFLLESKVINNIAFGISDNNIDLKAVNHAIVNSQLYDFIKNNPDGVYTNITERGANLSGGQIQRMAIARALYSNSDILIFDESTSALDSETEAKLIEFIVTLPPSITIIAISHNTKIFEKFDSVYLLEDGILSKKFV